MEYSKIIELDNVTLQDCVDLYENNGICAEVNDSHIKNFVRDGE